MTDTTAARPLPCGTWPSPITAADVAGQYRQVSFPVTIDGEVWWQETLPGELGRATVVHLGAAGKPRQVLSAPWNARTRVHEYGGRSYLPVRAARRGGGQSWAIVFANFADQRLYLADEPGTDGAGGTPRPLTPAPLPEPGTPEFRFADFALSPDKREVWCVQERHEAGQVTRAIVAVPLDGSAAGDAGAIRELTSGADFYAFPTPSPDGRRLAWVCWNHPRMPWDGTELRVARVDEPIPGKGGLVKGGVSESVLAPVWHDDTSLYLISDWPGWWNLYLLSVAAGPAEAVYPAEEEFAAPLWQLGQRPYAVLADGQLAVLHGCGGLRLGLLDPTTGELTDLDIPYQNFAPELSADGMSVVLVAGGPSTPMSVIRVDMTTGKAKKLYSPAGRLPGSGYLPKARKLEFEGKFGQQVHAWVYPPANPEATAGEGELPPYVVWAHGGPASQADRRLDMEKAYFTSRGVGVIDVNYGGSARLWPGVPGAAAPPVGRGRRGGRDRGSAGAGQFRRRGRHQAGDPRCLRGRLDRPGGGYRTCCRQPVQGRHVLLRHHRPAQFRRHHARFRVQVHRRPDRPAARFRGGLRGAFPRPAGQRPDLPHPPATRPG